MRGSDRQLSRIPYHIAVRLDNLDFSSFDAFRVKVWRLIAADPFVCDIYSDSQRRERAIKEGIAPLAPETQQVIKSSTGSYFFPGAVKHRVMGSTPELNSVVLESEMTADSLGSYQLHHHKPIHSDGGVYEISNIIIVTPLLHRQLLIPEYHYGSGEEMPEWKQQYIQRQIDAHKNK